MVSSTRASHAKLAISFIGTNEIKKLKKEIEANPQNNFSRYIVA